MKGWRGHQGHNLSALITGIGFCATLTMPVSAYAQQKQAALDIPAQNLGTALYHYTLQSGQQLAFDGNVVEGRKSTAVKGRYIPQEALKRLLTGTGIQFRTRSSGVIVLFKIPDAEPDFLPAPIGPPPSVVETEPTVVIVTATKRPRNIQNIPMAVSHVKPRLLEMGGADQVEDLSKILPSLTVIQGDSPANSALSIRGIGTVAFSIAVEPSVLVQVDDVPAMFQARSFVDLNDIERIEVLRGPQNTLYGKSSTGGTINIITNGPTKTFSASGTTLLTSDNEYRTNFQLSGPVKSNLFYRFAVHAGEYAGPSRNLQLGTRVNGYRNHTMRAKFLWVPRQNLTALFTVWHNDNRSNCCAYSLAASPADARLNPDRGPVSEYPAIFLEGISPSVENRSLRQDTATFANIVDRGVSAKVEYVLGDGYRLTSISSLTAFRMDDQIDSDAGIIKDYAARQIAAGQLSLADYERLLFVEPRFSNYTNEGNVQFGTFRASAKAQEIRLLSPVNDVRYMIGVFFSEQNNSLDRARGPAFIRQRWKATSKSRDADLFGQIDWYATPWTTASVGSRMQFKSSGYSFDDKLAKHFYQGNDSETSISYSLSLQHKVSHEAMLYGAIATGHKGKAYDLSSGFNQARADRGPVRPEESRSVEIGWRSRLKHNGITFNVSAFQVDYSNFQSQAIDYASSTFFLANVGKVRTQGVEFETSGLIAPHWRGTISGHYLDAQILQYEGAVCYPGQSPENGCQGTPGRQNLAGKPLPNAPRWKFSLLTDYNFYPDTRHLLAVGLGFRWQSDNLMAMNQDPASYQKSFGVVNLSATLIDRRERYTLATFVNNVFDTFYVSARESGGRTVPVSVIQIPSRDSGRYFGLRLTLRQ